MTENKDKLSAKDKDQKGDVHLTKDQENGGSRQPPAAPKEQLAPQQPTINQPANIAEAPTHSRVHHPQPHAQTPADRCRKLSHFLDMLNIPRHYTGGHHSASSSSNTSAQHSPLTAHAGMSAQGQMAATCVVSSDTCGSREGIDGDCDINSGMMMMMMLPDNRQQPQLLAQHDSQKENQNSPLLRQDVQHRQSSSFYGTTCLSFQSEIVFLDMTSGEIIDSTESYGREDEEVMGLRFCNEAIMSIHQIWPKNEEPMKESLSPLQEALLKRLGDGAHPFTLSLTAQAPPSVQLVPAKRYYGAPIGTSYDVRCFIADKTDEKFHRRASVKMGVRVIYRTDVFNHSISGPEHFAALINNPAAPVSTQTQSIGSSSANSQAMISSSAVNATESNVTDCRAKSRKSERGDSFPKLRLSPKAFRFSSRFGRSKSEVERCPSDPFHSYSKSFQEYDSAVGVSSVSGGGGGGPQGAVDKPFLLQDGRVGLRASLDKAWYTHGEEVHVTINIRNDSRKTVRKVRVCAIQHVDVCMFNNGKFKNVVADSDNLSPPALDRTVPPGGTLITTVSLRPQRGPTKNWIALEDTLQRSTEPDDITGVIAASAIRTPHILMQTNQSPYFCTSPGAAVPAMYTSSAALPNTSTNDERNVFAIYVSYYVKVKLTLSGIGGELSLKLPFLLVHIDEEQAHLAEQQIVKLALDDVPANKKNGNKTKPPSATVASCQEFAIAHNLERIESVDERSINVKGSPAANRRDSGTGAVVCEPDDDCQPSTSSGNNRRRQLIRSETIGKNVEDDHEADVELHPTNDGNLEVVVHVAQVHTNNSHPADDQSHQIDPLETHVSHNITINQLPPEASQQ